MTFHRIYELRQPDAPVLYALRGHSVTRDRWTTRVTPGRVTEGRKRKGAVKTDDPNPASLCSVLGQGEEGLARDHTTRLSLDSPL